MTSCKRWDDSSHTSGKSWAWPEVACASQETSTKDLNRSAFHPFKTWHDSAFQKPFYAVFCEFLREQDYQAEQSLLEHRCFGRYGLVCPDAVLAEELGQIAASLACHLHITRSD